MEILDKKSNRISRANAGVSKRREFPDFLEALSNYYLELLMMQILDFLSLRNLLSNELFFTFYYFAIASLTNIKYFILSKIIN